MQPSWSHPIAVKPSQRGLVDYFVALGQLTQLPLMIYHIPGRAAVSIKAQTVDEDCGAGFPRSGDSSTQIRISSC